MGFEIKFLADIHVLALQDLSIAETYDPESDSKSVSDIVTQRQTNKTYDNVDGLCARFITSVKINLDSKSSVGFAASNIGHQTGPRSVSSDHINMSSLLPKKSIKDGQVTEISAGNNNGVVETCTVISSAKVDLVKKPPLHVPGGVAATSAPVPKNILKHGQLTENTNRNINSADRVLAEASRLNVSTRQITPPTGLPKTNLLNGQVTDCS